MTGGLLTLSTRETDTLVIITRLAEGRMTQTEAARCLGLSDRQVRKLLRAFEKDGAAGLRDKRRGRPAPNRIPEEYHEIRVATETLRQWMIADGIWKTRAHRRRRG